MVDIRVGRGQNVEASITGVLIIYDLNCYALKFLLAYRQSQQA